MLLGLAAATGICAVSGCARPEDRLPPGDCSFLVSLRVDDAERDANASILAKDFRLLAVYGYSLEVPGLYYFDYYAARDRGELRPIECTSDGIVSARHMRLNEDAYDYATRYNAVVLRQRPQPPEKLPLPAMERGPDGP